MSKTAVQTQRASNRLSTGSNMFNLCKRKLQCKTEGLLVLAKELDNVRQEKDAYKLMAEQLREKYHGQKRKYEDREKALGLSLDENDPLSERRSQSLAQILCETREQNRKAEDEIKELRLKLTESEGDMKILRENIARQRVGDEGVGMRHFPAHERETLVAQLEAAREQAENLERDMVAKIDELQEHVTERDFFRRKADHLNEELNYVLGGNEKRIVDIDALLMENKYVKERLKQVQEEKSHAQATAAKYKSVLEKRKGKGFLKSHSGGSLVLSQKQVENLLGESKAGSLPVTSSTVSDLHSLSRALLETIHDKNVAINHQRNTNKILGKRVEELENKLKTLEVAGLWNLPTARTAALKAWQLEMSPDSREALVPRRVSVETNSSEQSESLKSEFSSEASTPQHQIDTKKEHQPTGSPDIEGHREIQDEKNNNPETTVGEDEAEEIREEPAKATGDGEPNQIMEDASVQNGESSRRGGEQAASETGMKDEEDAGDTESKEEEEDGDGVMELASSVETSPRLGEAELKADRNTEQPSNDDNMNVLESLFDTVAEKIVKQKSSQNEAGDGESVRANPRTPLLPPGSYEDTPTETPSSPDKTNQILVDTSPQCV
ncbi:putative coiled-coil domain-containing protein [Apostichopus japonicus]|uniref:Putative coiled-coil domain-containing protein n=1 Tax=Stichopus japonicus TaxID=307972 RepID=A0A2G8L0C5_STIJA|nr:putative coiled-coil domain-containing protein [Apostichopus japonicus]